MDPVVYQKVVAAVLALGHEDKVAPEVASVAIGIQCYRLATSIPD